MIPVLHTAREVSFVMLAKKFPTAKAVVVTLTSMDTWHSNLLLLTERQDYSTSFPFRP